MVALETPIDINSGLTTYQPWKQPSASLAEACAVLNKSEKRKGQAGFQ
jgi:hypothetical protein